MKRLLENLLAILVLSTVLVNCGGAGSSSTSDYGSGNHSNSSGSPDGDGSTLPLTWSTNADSSAIYQDTPVTVTFGSGVLVTSVSGNASYTSYMSGFTALGLPFAIDMSFSGNTITFTANTGELGGWPLGDVEFNFSALTNLGAANGVIAFTVDDATTEPAAPPCISPTTSFTGTDKVIYTRTSSLQVSQIFRVDINTLEVDQLSHDLSHNEDANFDYDGRISFASDRIYGDGDPNDSDWEIYRMDPDGANLCLATNDHGVNRSPSLSPALDRMAYSGNSGIFLADPDGSNEVTLFSNQNANGYPNWCPNDVIVYVSSGVIKSINPDGTGDQAIAGLPTGISSGVNCCTDAFGTTKITFALSSQIRVANLDGSTYLSNVTSGRVPDFNEDCTKLAFLRDTTVNSQTTTDLYIADFDGMDTQNITQLTFDGNSKNSPTLR